eukprot:738571-Prymnesium_polylepis.1
MSAWQRITAQVSSHTGTAVTSVSPNVFTANRPTRTQISEANRPRATVNNATTKSFAGRCGLRGAHATSGQRASGPGGRGGWRAAEVVRLSV